MSLIDDWLIYIDGPINLWLFIECIIKIAIECHCSKILLLRSRKHYIIIDSSIIRYQIIILLEIV